MRSVFASIWDVVKPEVTGILGTEESRQDKVTSLLIDKPFEFGKDLGLYGDKIQAPELIDTTNPNNTVKQNAIASMNDGLANMAQDSEIFRKNLPSSLFEIGEFGIDLAMNPIKYGKEAINLASGFATMPFEMIDNASNEEMAHMVVDSTIDFFKTEGALRKAALENPADVLAIMFGGASGIRRLQQLKPETTERIMTTIKNVGATPVGLSMRDVSNNNDLTTVGGTEIANQRQLANVDEAGFYSKAEQAIFDSMPNELPKNQVRGWFEKRGVSQTELADLGILSMIDNMEEGKKVTKEGLLEHIADQQLTFSGTTLADTNNFDYDSDHYDPDNHSLQMPDATADYMNRYNNGDVNWNQILRSDDEPDDWLDIQGNNWRLSPDSEDRAVMYAEDIFLDEIGSSERINPSPDGEIARTMGGSRNHYPFNNVPDRERMEGDPEIGYNGDFRDHMDISNLTLVRYMHEANPERYPKTKSMELKGLYSLLESNKRLENDATGTHPEILQLLRDNAEPTESVMQQIAMLEADIMDDIRSGNLEWDIEMLREADGLNTPYDMPGINRRKYDMQDALEKMGRDLYLNDPEFEIFIPVEDVDYTAYGNDSIGYRISTPHDGFNHNSNDLEDIYDLPALESGILEHARQEGYLDSDNALDDRVSDGSPNWEQFTLNRQHPEARKDNYKEELIILTPDSEQRRGGYQFESGVHYRGHKNLFAHLRKSDRVEVGTSSPDVYFIEELQSDFQQTRRELGATKEETDDLKFKNRMNTYDTGEMIDAWEDLGDGADLASFTATTNDGELGWKKLVKTQEQKDLYKQAMLTQTNAYQLANFQSTSGDVKKNARAQIKEWEDNWDVNPKNPDSPNWSGMSRDDYYELGQYLSKHIDALNKTHRKLDNHSHTSRTPIQGDRWYTTSLNYAIMKAVEEGKNTIAWATSDQILDQWNPTRGTDHNKKINFKESYSNTYDKKLPKIAKKLAKKYGGKFEVIKIDLGNGNFSENYSIRLTPEMIDNMIEEFPANTESGFARPTHGKLQQIPSGLLQTDIIEQQGLLA